MKKKRILKVGSFILAVALTLVLPGMLLKPKTMNRFHLDAGRVGVFSRIKIEPKNSIDVVVLGDSESYCSFSPMQLWEDYGYTSYVAGVPGAKIGDNYDVLKTVFARQKPKVVLLETNNLFRYQPPNNVDAKTTRAIYKRLPFLKYHSVWKSPLSRAKGAMFQGFNVNGSVHPYMGGEYMCPSTEKERIFSPNRRYFHGILRLCQKNGAKLVMYSAPSPRNYNYKKHNALKILAEKNGLSYVDLNVKAGRLEIDWMSDTRDHGDHLNLAGAQKTTAFLGYYLDKTCDLTCRRNTGVAARWNRMLRSYKIRTKRAEHSIWKKMNDWEEEVDNEVL